MQSLHPTIWRTCRVLSNEVRIKLLWKLFQMGEASVAALGDSVGISESQASVYLRALNSRGLVVPERRQKYVFYRSEANPEVEHAEVLLHALRDCYDHFMPLEMVVSHMTAFTHPRRIDIVRALSDVAYDEQKLSIQTQISLPALYRHLRKLTDRGYVAKTDKQLHLVPQENSLSKTLLTIATGS